MGERYNIHSQLEHLQSKYIGTGHADTSKWEWVTNQHRDSYALYMVRQTAFYIPKLPNHTSIICHIYHWRPHEIEFFLY